MKSKLKKADYSPKGMSNRFEFEAEARQSVIHIHLMTVNQKLKADLVVAAEAGKE